jgi:hypothetical protein
LGFLGHGFSLLSFLMLLGNDPAEWREPMDRTFKPAVAALILIVDFAGSSAGAGPFEDGDAARRADYATVMRLWRPLAEQGDARAQSNLALMGGLNNQVQHLSVRVLRWEPTTSI